MNSIGNFHNFITEYCGFSDNGKVSELAGYGKVRNNLKKNLEKLITVNYKGIFLTEKDFKQQNVVQIISI